MIVRHLDVFFSTKSDQGGELAPPWSNLPVNNLELDGSGCRNWTREKHSTSDFVFYSLGRADVRMEDEQEREGKERKKKDTANSVLRLITTTYPFLFHSLPLQPIAVPLSSAFRREHLLHCISKLNRKKIILSYPPNNPSAASAITILFYPFFLFVNITM